MSTLFKLAPRWVPVGPDSVQLPAGRWWDAVEVPAYLGDRALALLGDHSGAVIRDPYGRRMIWLIPPNTATSWTFAVCACTHVLGVGCRVIVPPGHRVCSAHTHRIRRADVDGDDLLTDAEELRVVLDEVIAATFGPRPVVAS